MDPNSQVKAWHLQEVELSKVYVVANNSHPWTLATGRRTLGIVSSARLSVTGVLVNNLSCRISLDDLPEDSRSWCTYFTGGIDLA